MQFVSSSENTVLAPGVAVRDGSLTAAVLPSNSAPGDVVTVLPMKGGFTIQASSVNGTAGGKDCFKAEIVVQITTGGANYADGDEILVKKGAATVMTLQVVTDGAGAVTGVSTADTRTSAVELTDALTVDCSGSGDGDATATASLRNPNASVKCTHTSGGKWICVCTGSTGIRRAL